MRGKYITHQLGDHITLKFPYSLSSVEEQRKVRVKKYAWRIIPC